MRCTQAVAYPYFVVALLLYGLQMAFGLLSAASTSGRIRSRTGCRSTFQGDLTRTCSSSGC